MNKFIPNTIICSKTNPWDWINSKYQQVIHEDAVDIGKCNNGCCDKKYCPNCQYRFTMGVSE